jgi:hypothetical protein
MPAVRDLRLSTVGGIWAPLVVGIVAAGRYLLEGLTTIAFFAFFAFLAALGVAILRRRGGRAPEAAPAAAS